MLPNHSLPNRSGKIAIRKKSSRGKEMTSRLLHLQIPSPPTTLLLHIQCTHTQTIITAEIQGGKFGMQRTALTKGEYAKIEDEIMKAWEEKAVECYIPPATSNEREEEEQETDEETGTKQNKARKKNIRHKEKKEFKIYFGDTEVKMQTLSAEEEYLARTRIWNLFYNVLEQTTNGYTTVPKKQGEKEKEELQSELTKMEAKVESLQVRIPRTVQVY